MREFGKASGDLGKGFDQAGFDAGRSLGGIHGKPAFEAITLDNKNVELYDPAVSGKKRSKQPGWRRSKERKKMNRKQWMVILLYLPVLGISLCFHGGILVWFPALMFACAFWVWFQKPK
jgi:hypothetical protein